jgi:hypothetical protein
MAGFSLSIDNWQRGGSTFTGYSHSTELTNMTACEGWKDSENFNDLVGSGLKPKPNLHGATTSEVSRTTLHSPNSPRLLSPHVLVQIIAVGCI